MAGNDTSLSALEHDGHAGVAVNTDATIVKRSNEKETERDALVTGPSHRALSLEYERMLDDLLPKHDESNSDDKRRQREHMREWLSAETKSRGTSHVSFASNERV
jgi:hypothetical protein